MGVSCSYVRGFLPSYPVAPCFLSTLARKGRRGSQSGKGRLRRARGRSGGAAAHSASCGASGATPGKASHRQGNRPRQTGRWRQAQYPHEILLDEQLEDFSLFEDDFLQTVQTG